MALSRKQKKEKKRIEVGTLVKITVGFRKNKFGIVLVVDDPKQIRNKIGVHYTHRMYRIYVQSQVLIYGYNEFRKIQ